MTETFIHDEDLDLNDFTPAMRQFIEVKRRYPETLVLFRMGDFYETFFDDAAKAKEMIALYTNNKVATLQAANDFDGIIAMADALLAKNAENALAQKVCLQAYASKKDYNKVIELGEAAAKVQTDPEDVSLMYLTLGAAYNAKEMKPQAIEAFRKVTAGPAVESAKAALAELTK